MVHPCPAGSHHHVKNPIVFVEVLDDRVRSCKTGEGVRFAVPVLFGTAQPLVRHGTGNFRAIGPSRTCDRVPSDLPRMRGRATLLLLAPLAAGNRRLWPGHPIGSPFKAEIIPLPFPGCATTAGEKLSENTGELCSNA
jgi:hypothetical protein